MRKNILLIIVWILVMFSVSACTESGNGAESGDQDVKPTSTLKTSDEPREITGEEALELFGIGGDGDVEPVRTPIQWFPITVWVNVNELPYDPEESADEVAVFSRWELSDDGTWLGDILSDTEVTLFNISEDGTACLIEGMAKQGWEVKGWVACNRLDFYRK